MPALIAASLNHHRPQLCLKREVVARERPNGGMTRRFFAELAKTQHPGVQPFTTLQGGLAR